MRAPPRRHRRRRAVPSRARAHRPRPPGDGAHRRSSPRAGRRRRLRRTAGHMKAAVWMRSNLATQGYCLSDSERRQLWLGVRFSTGLCLTLVLVALALESPVVLFALFGIGVIAGFTARHPFDHLWNYGFRHLVGGPP